MSQTVEHLEKILGDLTSNRARLVEQMNVTKQQLEVNESQLEHFDTLIATTRTVLGDASVITRIDEVKAQPQPEEPAQPPLGAAGAGAETAPAPASADVPHGAVQG